MLLLAVAAVVAGALRMTTGGGVLLPVAGAVVALGAVAVLQRAATVAAAHRAVVAVDHAVPVGPARQSFTDWQRTEQERPTWTPVPLPKPLYLDREEAAALPAARSSAAEALRAAAEQAEEALRQAHAAAEVVAIEATTDERRAGRVAREPATSEPVLSDLDAVLRRRRAG